MTLNYLGLPILFLGTSMSSMLVKIFINYFQIGLGLTIKVQFFRAIKANILKAKVQSVGSSFTFYQSRKWVRKLISTLLVLLKVVHEGTYRTKR